MIWLVTLVLLALFAWLLLNAFNEKQWVDAHLHDENVASDAGLFGSLTTSTGNPDNGGAGGNASLGDKIAQARQSETAARLRDTTSGIKERIKSEMTEETGMLNKVKKGVTSGVEKAAQQVDDKIVNRPKK